MNRQFRNEKGDWTELTMAKTSGTGQKLTNS